MKNYADRGGCYPPKPSASADNTLLDLHNSSYHTQPHPIIAKYCYKRIRNVTILDKNNHNYRYIGEWVMIFFSYTINIYVIM